MQILSLEKIKLVSAGKLQDKPLFDACFIHNQIFPESPRDCNLELQKKLFPYY